MARYFDFNGFNFNCENCKGFIVSDLSLYEKTLLIDINKCFFDTAQKTGTIAISDDSMLTDEEIEAQLRIALIDWLPKKEVVKKDPHHLLQADIGIFSGAIMMSLMFLNIHLPMWAHDLMLYSGIGIIAVISYPSLKKAWDGLRSKQRRINMDSLFALSTIAALASSILHLYFPFMPSMIDAALMINGFRHFGLWIDETFKKPTATHVRFVDRGRKSTFQISNAGVYEDFAANNLREIRMGSLIRVPKGQCIPLNGILQEESAAVSFVMHTGKDDIVTVTNGQQVLAGMMVESESLTFKVNALEEQSYLRARDLSAIGAQSKAAPIQDLTSRILTWFMPAVLFIAVAIGGVSGYFNGIGSGVETFLYFLVCACPCALGMVTPLAVSVGLKKLSDDGVRFKTAKGIQAAADSRIFVFDLNGTLTKNAYKVSRCTIPWMYFSLIHAMESESTNQIGKAIFNYIYPVQMRQNRVYLDDLDTTNHHGVIATFQGSEYRIGNKEFINPPADKSVTDFEGAQHAIYFSKNDVVQGHFLLEDPLRDKDQAVAMIQNLQDNGITVKVFTGASKDTAKQYSSQLGLHMDAFVTGCIPTKKSELIEALQAEGNQVAMFGDAGNDLEAIKQADFGVVVYSRSTDPLNEQESDAAIHSETLLPQVLKLVAVGRQTMRHIKQNLAVSFAYNTLSLVYVSCAMLLKPDLLTPALGAGLMVFQSLFIVLNAMRINHQEAKLTHPMNQATYHLPALSLQQPIPVDNNAQMHHSQHVDIAPSFLPHHSLRGAQ